MPDSADECFWDAWASSLMWDWRGQVKLGAYTAELNKWQDRPLCDEVCAVMCCTYELHDSTLDFHAEYCCRALSVRTTRRSRSNTVVEQCCREKAVVVAQLSCCLNVPARLLFHETAFATYASALFPGVEIFPFFHARAAVWGAWRHSGPAWRHDRLVWCGAELDLAAQGWDHGPYRGRAGAVHCHMCGLQKACGNVRALLVACRNISRG